MEKLAVVVLSCSVLLLAGLNAALAQQETVDVAVGGKLSFSPSFSGSINSLLWKHKGNMVIEWVKDKFNKTYGNFQHRTNMDTATGKLEIMNMTAADAGLYTVEINKKDQGRLYNVNVINKVTKPSIVFQPLACPSTDNCDLRCDGGTEGAGEVSYYWKTGDKDWQLKEKTLSISRASNLHDLTFTCRIKNPVSEEDSKPEDNPFYKEEEVTPGNGGKIAAGIIGALIIIGAIVIAVLIYLEKVAMPSCLRGNRTNDNELAGAYTSVPGNGDNAKADGAGDVEVGTRNVQATPTGENTKADGAPGAGDVEVGTRNAQATPTGENTKADSAPATGNGAKSPENSDEAHEPESQT